MERVIPRTFEMARFGSWRLTMNLKSAILPAAAFLFAAAHGHANLITKGGFETGGFNLKGAVALPFAKASG